MVAFPLIWLDTPSESTCVFLTDENVLGKLINVIDGQAAEQTSSMQEVQCRITFLTEAMKDRDVYMFGEFTTENDDMKKIVMLLL